MEKALVNQLFNKIVKNIKHIQLAVYLLQPRWYEILILRLVIMQEK